MQSPGRMQEPMVKESGIGRGQLDRSLEGTGACEGAGEWEGIARYGSGMSAKAWKGRGPGRCKSVGGTRSWEWEGAARHGPGIGQESGKVQEPRRGHNLGRVQEPGRGQLDKVCEGHEYGTGKGG